MPRKAPPLTRERLLQRVKIDPETGCWNWQGAHTNDGYGLVGRGPNRLAHRKAYILFVGPIPPGFEIDHLCRNEPCINPEHIEAVTPRVNKMRSKSPWALNAAKTHCKRGHELSGGNLRLTKSGRACRECDLIHGRAFEARHPERNNHSRHKKPAARNHPEGK